MHNVIGFIFLSCPIFPELNFPETAVFLRPSPTSKTKIYFSNFLKSINQFLETHLEFLVISENFQPAAHIFCNRVNFRLPKFHGKCELRSALKNTIMSNPRRCNCNRKTFTNVTIQLSLPIPSPYGRPEAERPSPSVEVQLASVATASTSRYEFHSRAGR